MLLLCAGLFGLSVVFELAIHRLRRPDGAARRVFGILAVVFVVAALWCQISVLPLSILMVLLAGVTLYRMVNVARILKARMHPAYLRRATARTTVWLSAAQSVLLLAAYLDVEQNVPYAGLLLGLIVAELLGAGLLVLSVRRYRLSKKTADDLDMSAGPLPTVSVAIPARNETDDLDACLRSLVASDYPKLEILVLDDCSQTTRTPEIIRSYAHAGVRFISGKEPLDTWLPKNQAYATLAGAASGDLILFAGVDIRWQPDTIRKLVGAFRAADVSMFSVLPKNELPDGHVPLLQPMRYFMELAMFRGVFGRPPVLSSCWLISRKGLKRAGGFGAVSRMVLPEAYFARQADANGGYRFIADGAAYGVSSTKSIAEQRATSIRTAYPRLRRRPEQVVLVSACIIAAATLPLSLLAAGLVDNQYRLHAAAALLSILMLWAAYCQVLILAYGRLRTIDALMLPLAVILELGLLQYSMYKYEFDEVIWKDRNVCIPAMHVVPRLPEV